METRLKISTLLFALFSCFYSNAQNPIIQTIFTADPAALVYKDTLFLYTGHDEDKSKNFTMIDWHVFSTTDMVNWTDRGTPISIKTFNWASKNAWASQCIERKGKFFWYICARDTAGKTAIGVAVSDNPTGPFVDAIGKPLLSANRGYIDPAVFIDDDGQAYLYWGNPGLWYVKLNENMTSYNTEMGVVQVPLTKEGFNIRLRDVDKRPTSYEEAPWLYKQKGLYYLIYAAGGVPEHLAYSIGKSAEGPWIYQDTLMARIKKGGAFTNHPALTNYKGKTYLFYHNAALPGGGGFNRSVCVDEMKFNANGTIPRVIPTPGISKGAGLLNPFKRVEAETMAWEQGVETASAADVGVYVTDIDNSDYIKVRSVDLKKGAKSFEASIAPLAGGRIEIRIDKPGGALLGSCDVSNIQASATWSIVSTKISQVKGVHDLYFIFKGGENKLFNLDWWKLNVR